MSLKELRRHHLNGQLAPQQDLFAEGLREIRKRTGVLPPIADLTGEVKRLGTVPFSSGATSDIWLGKALSRSAESVFERPFTGEWLGEQVALKALRNVIDLDERTARHFNKEVEVWRSLQVSLHVTYCDAHLTH